MYFLCRSTRFRWYRTSTVTSATASWAVSETLAGRSPVTWWKRNPGPRRINKTTCHRHPITWGRRRSGTCTSTGNRRWTSSRPRTISLTAHRSRRNRRRSRTPITSHRTAPKDWRHNVYSSICVLTVDKTQIVFLHFYYYYYYYYFIIIVIIFIHYYDLGYKLI